MCITKNEEELGFRKAKDASLAYMMKLAGGIVGKTESLWVKVLRNTYGCSNDTLPEFRNRSEVSNAWRGTMLVWPYFKHNLIWRVSNGQTVKFWTNNWLTSI